ncbi:MAG: DUF2304 domain-containing protein [Candidatus Sumerlaeota bacterium]|nr:DUF2304 domain-containing protein [Candidatus Sumerlaeota bacterium]
MIKIVLIAGLTACFLVYFAKVRTMLSDRLVGLALFIAGLLFVLFPNLTYCLAGWLGVGRGADVVFYFAIVAFLFFIILIRAHLLEQERQITELTRAIAMLTAREGGEPPADES